MNLTDNKRLFSLTPVVEAQPPGRECKYPMRGVSDIGTLNELITFQGNLVNDKGYKGRLMFQYNVAFDKQFYIINANELASFGSMLLLGGCICIKFRIGATVYRYKLMDYKGINADWSGFIPYTNGLILPNFCIEFWQDDYSFLRGVTQPFMIKTSTIVIPTDSDQDNSYDNGQQTLMNLADMATPFPAFFPINNANQAFLDNIP